MASLICTALSLFLIAMFARIVLSYFPLSPSSPMSSVYSVLYSITEPVLGPLRSVIPSIGMFDISPIVVIIGVQIIQSSIGCRGVF